MKYKPPPLAAIFFFGLFFSSRGGGGGHGPPWPPPRIPTVFISFLVYPQVRIQDVYKRGPTENFVNIAQQSRFYKENFGHKIMCAGRGVCPVTPPPPISEFQGYYKCRISTIVYALCGCLEQGLGECNSPHRDVLTSLKILIRRLSVSALIISTARKLLLVRGLWIKNRSAWARKSKVVKVKLSKFRGISKYGCNSNSRSRALFN